MVALEKQLSLGKNLKKFTTYELYSIITLLCDGIIQNKMPRDEQIHISVEKEGYINFLFINNESTADNSIPGDQLC